MADDKEKKGGGGGGDVWEMLEIGLVILLGLYIVYRIIVGIFYGAESFAINHLDPSNAFRRLFADLSLENAQRVFDTSWIGSLISFVKVLLFVLSAGFIALSVFLYKKIMAFYPPEPMTAQPAGTYVVEDDPMQKRWKRIMSYARSENAGDWRLAILEADIILDEILDVNGYRGDTLGDKLKAVEPADMPSINAAWEAHKIRNAIAHEGESFTLTEREAKRVIALYAEVFKDFGLL